MILVLDEGLVEEAPPSPEDRLVTLARLLHAHRGGDHLLSCSHVVARWLAEVGERLGDAERAVVRRVMREATEQASLLAEAAIWIRIGPSDWKIGLEGRQLRAPWSAFAGTSAGACTRLIAEQLDRDCKLYSKLAHEDGRRRGFPVKLATQGGGGSQTGAAIEQSMKEGRITIGVVDGDRRAPSVDVGETARKARQLLVPLGARIDAHATGGVESPCTALGALLVLDARTIENLLPNCWLTAWLDPVVVARVEAALPHQPGLHVYVNRKDGVDCPKTVGPGAEATYLREVLSVTCGPCAASGACALGEPISGEKRCSKSLISGFGGGALRAVTGGVEAANAELIHQGLGESPELTRVVQVLADWGRAAAFRAG